MTATSADKTTTGPRATTIANLAHVIYMHEGRLRGTGNALAGLLAKAGMPTATAMQCVNWIGCLSGPCPRGLTQDGLFSAMAVASDFAEFDAAVRS